MGRLAKNLQIHTGSYAIRMPVGTSSIAPQSPRDGQIRFNETSNKLELFYASLWHSLGTTGRVEILKDTFTGNGIDDTFPMFYAPNGPEGYLAGQEADLLVFVGGVFQEPGVAYTITGNSISFTGTPDYGIPIVVLHNFNSTHVR